MLFRIKICGITTPEDALAAEKAGADAVGLNFFPGSKRHVSESDAIRIVDALPAHVARVGVFVNQHPNEVRGLAERFDLDWVQLHGDESDEWLESLRPYGLLAVARLQEGVSASEVAEVGRRLNRLAPAAALVERRHGAEFGGTGVAVDWQAAALLRSHLTMPLVLAGGLQGG